MLVDSELFIDGEFRSAQNGAQFETLEPALGRLLSLVADASAADLDRAVGAARAALDGPWGQMKQVERARILRRIAAGIDSNLEDLARLESRDTGKAIRDCRAQVRVTAEWFDFFADAASQLRTSVIPTSPGLLNYTLRQPVGVVAAITPWNAPLVVYGIKLSAALAVGNTVVLKPAEQAPLSALALAGICRDAGLPQGALNVVTGGVELGKQLVDHQGIDFISFTGSTSVGRAIASSCGSKLRSYTLELGGKSPSIVFADSDLEAAAKTALFSFSVNQGQVCTAGSRLLVQDSVHDKFLSLLVRHLEDVRVGDPLDDDTQIGAVISQQQLDRIEHYVELGVQAGAEVVSGGSRPIIAEHEGGTFFTPTVFAGVSNDMTIAQDEIFGPVVSVMPFKDEAHAVKLANDTLYGLAAGIWTSDIGRAHRMAAAVDAGLVYVNTMHELSPNSPYSGWKQSGVGVEGGIEQAEEFTQLKSVWINYDSTPPTL